MDPEIVLTSNQLADSQITVDDVDNLIERAHRIVVRYTVLFSANSYLTEIVGQDDYTSVLRLMRKGLEAKDDELHTQLKTLGLDPGRRPANPALQPTAAGTTRRRG